MWASVADVSGSLSLQGAVRAFLRGQYGVALDIVMESPAQPERFLFGAHIAFRMRQYAEALQWLDAGRQKSAFVTAHHRTMSLAIEAAALASSGRVAEASKTLRSILLPPPFNALIAGEIAYYTALCAWLLRDYNQALSILDATDVSTSPNLQARFEFMRGWVHGAHGRFAEQVACNLRAIHLFEEEAAPDVGAMAMVLRSLSMLARDLVCPHVVPVIARTESTISWTDDLSLEHFQVLRALAWSSAMSGEYILSIRRLNEAKVVAPSPQGKMLSHLDHAWIAQLSKEPLHLRAELAEADACAAQVQWETVVDEEAGALMLAAELYAPINETRAFELLALAQTAREKLSPWLQLGRDSRVQGFFDFAEAHVRLARGDRRVARHRAERAFTVFSEVGYEWRAANAALFLYRLTERQDWLECVERVAAIYPRSFLAAELERIRSRGVLPIEKLTNREQEIAELVKCGLKTKEIADRLGISANTVRVHKGNIFRTLGVSDEFALLKMLMRL